MNKQIQSVAVQEIKFHTHLQSEVGLLNHPLTRYSWTAGTIMTTKGMLAANAYYAEVGDVCRYKLNDMRL